MTPVNNWNRIPACGGRLGRAYLDHLRSENGYHTSNSLPRATAIEHPTLNSKENPMKRIFAIVAMVAMFSLAASAAAKKGTWSGWVGDEKCGTGVKADCVKKCLDAGEKMVFVTDKTRKVVAVANPELLKDHAGHHVRVKGTLDNDTLTVASVTMLKDQSMK
jgi:hypothetical protein